MAEERSLSAVLLYDIDEEFYRLNIYNGNDENLFSNLFSIHGLSFSELINILNIYEIPLSEEIRKRIENEISSTERKRDYEVLIPKVEFI